MKTDSDVDAQPLARGATVTSNQSMEVIASRCYELPFGSLDRYPIAMRPLARDTSSWSR